MNLIANVSLGNSELEKNQYKANIFAVYVQYFTAVFLEKVYFRNQKLEIKNCTENILAGVLIRY
jgi:hypothetical protein